MRLRVRGATSRRATHILATISAWRGGQFGRRVAVGARRSDLDWIALALNDVIGSIEASFHKHAARIAELEASLADEHLALEAEIGKRQAAQALLFQAQKMEIVGQLTGGVAHDFNNLLTAIVGNLELAKHWASGGPEIGELLDNALRAADRGAALTQRLLAFSRRQHPALHAVDLVSLLDGMQGLLAHTLGNGVSLAIDLPKDTWKVYADLNQLEMVLLNLAINARDAMPEGGKLEITGRNGRQADARSRQAPLPPGEYVCLSVCDTGIGMDAATLARAMEPFFTTKPVGFGSGLGLSMALGVVEQIGGALDLASRKGEGTTVTILLPRALVGISGADPGRSRD